MVHHRCRYLSLIAQTRQLKTLPTEGSSDISASLLGVGAIIARKQYSSCLPDWGIEGVSGILVRL